MRSNDWLSESVRAWATISFAALAACGALTAQPAGPAKVPALALMDQADAEAWRNWTKELGWRVLIPAGLPANPTIDQRVIAVAAAAREAAKDPAVDPARIYLAGRLSASAGVFYAISRTPDVWAAGLALGGSPQPAIDSGRVYAINFKNAPVLWVGANADDQALAGKLKDGGLNLEYRPAENLPMAALFQWLAGHTRADFPDSIDCETNSPKFASCWWVRMMVFDVNERNDILPTTLIPPNSGATLDLGDFTYKKDDPGPGVLVSLPAKYSGPLKNGDRLLSLDGKPIENARQFAETMATTVEEKPAAVMVERGKNRVRLETRIVLPKRDAFATARAQARFIVEDREIQIATRTVTQLQVTIPPHWVPATLYWNGLSMEEIKAPGCIALKMEKELLSAERCQ
jgi:hypothetical protein